MDKNYYLILLIALIAIPNVLANEYTIETLKYCEGIIKVKDKTEGVFGYSLKDCARKDNSWECPCSPLPRPIVVFYNNDEVNTYDFIIEYYVGDNSEEYNKRTYSFEGLQLGGVKEKKPFSMPILEQNTKTLLIVGLGLLGLIILIIVGFVIKKLLETKDFEDTSDYPKDYNQEPTTVEVETEDKELSNILGKYG